MAEIFQIKKELLQIIRDKLIPWAHRSGSHSCILARPPLHVPPGVSVSSRSVAPLVKTAEVRHCMRYEDAKMVASRFPYFGCVLEGEADLIVGSQVQEPVAVNRKKRNNRAQKAPAEDNTRQTVLAVPARTFIIYPPGVPRESGSRPHWERPHQERAQAKIFWMDVVPAGVLCHTCATVKGQHMAQQYLFLYDPRILPLFNDFMEELAGRQPRYELIAQSYLLAVLGRLERGIQAGTILPAADPPYKHDVQIPMGGEENVEHALVLQRACQYIRSHLHEPLSPDIVARQVHISAPHLMRLFRLKQGTTIMKYAEQCRIEYAKSLLRDTDLYVKEISKLVGYRRVQHFSHAFSVAAGMSPLEFREKKR